MVGALLLKNKFGLLCITMYYCWMKATKKKNIQTAFTLSIPSFTQVKKIAKEEKRSQSMVMNILIDEALEIRKSKKQ